MNADDYIYLIEDDELMVGIYVRLLKLSGFEVQLATTGDQAMEAFKTMEKKPRLILLDIMIPGVSGFEVLEHIKENDALKDIPVVVLSNLFERSDIDKAMGLGAAAYLVKSQNTPEDIIGKVREVLGA